MGTDLRSIQENGGYSRTEIMRAREEDAQRLREQWADELANEDWASRSAPPGPERVVADEKAPGHALVLEVDRITRERALELQLETKRRQQ